MGVDYSAEMILGFSVSRADFLVAETSVVACQCGLTTAGKFCPDCGGRVEQRTACKYRDGVIDDEWTEWEYMDVGIHQVQADDDGQFVLGVCLRSVGEDSDQEPNPVSYAELIAAQGRIRDAEQRLFCGQNRPLGLYLTMSW